MASASVGDCLSGAWGTFKKNVLTHVVCTLLVMVVAGISAGLLAGPMMVGYMRMIERETRGEAVQIGDVFRGFDDFVPAFVAGLISSLVVSLGFMLCFIPGLLIMALPPVALFLVARGARDVAAGFSYRDRWGDRRVGQGREFDQGRHAGDGISGHHLADGSVAEYRANRRSPLRFVAHYKSW